MPLRLLVAKVSCQFRMQSRGDLMLCMDKKNLQYYEALWSEIKQKENPQQFWDKRAAHFNQPTQTKRNRLTETVDFLKSIGLKKNDMVLDIGCATGKLAMQLQKYVHSIHGIDISPKMIAYAVENAQKGQYTNLTYETAIWADIDLYKKKWEKHFDWVIASMTPGVYNFHTLKKMNEASRKHCFLSTIVNRKNDWLEQLHHKFSFIRPQTEFKNGTYCIFNLLWLMGYMPEVRYIESVYTNQWTIEEAEDMLWLGELPQEKRQAVQMDLKRNAKDGRIFETVHTPIAFIHWRVDQHLV